MGKFRKKPVVIEAHQWTGSNWLELRAWADALQGGTQRHFSYYANSNELFIDTLEGDMEVSPGDWVIRGVEGEFYPCKPGIFEKTYEAA